MDEKKKLLSEISEKVIEYKYFILIKCSLFPPLKKERKEKNKLKTLLFETNFDNMGS